MYILIEEVPKINDLSILTLGSTVEYRPNKSLISLNTDLGLLLNNKEIIYCPIIFKICNW